MSDLEANLRSVRQRMDRAASRAGRDPGAITLVAVSKTFSAEIIHAAYALGVRDFGENRVEEAEAKIPLVNQQLRTPPAWHMVGHLQRRKVRTAAALFDFIHSIDSVATAKRLDDRASELRRTIPILLETNVSGEASKYGFTPEPRGTFLAEVSEILALRNLDAQGLMTMAPIVAKAEDARPFFGALRELRDRLRTQFPGHAWKHLSMGMTDDFEAAIMEGATIVRIGRAIFGERN